MNWNQWGQNIIFLLFMTAETVIACLSDQISKLIVDFSIVEIRIRQDTALWSISILSFLFTFIIFLQIDSEKEKFYEFFFHILLLNSLLQGTYWRESTMLNDNNLDRKIY